MDARSPTIDVELLASDNDDMDSDDEALPVTQNIKYNLADKEVNDFESFKRNTHRPSFAKKEEGLTGMFQGSLKEIVVGTAITHGKDLPLGNNLFDYIDKQGWMCLIHFFEDHKDRFPNMWILVQREASCRVVEVGCGRFFGLYGYISSPRRTRLGIRNYEWIAMLASIMRVMYIDPEWVATEYFCRCMSGAWKKESNDEALKCWNLEQILDAERFGEPKPPQLTMNDLLSDLEGDKGSAEDGVVQI